MPCISFSGGGWMYVYHWGVAEWLQQHVVTHDDPRLCFAGASAGACTAAALAMGMDMKPLVSDVYDTYDECCGPLTSLRFLRMVACVERAIRAHAPDDAAPLCDGRLAVSLVPERWRTMMESWAKTDDEVAAKKWGLEVALLKRGMDVVRRRRCKICRCWPASHTRKRSDVNRLSFAAPVWW